MTHWTRATRLIQCGLDVTHQIPVGAPVLETQIRGLKRTLSRCQVCAGEAPPDLPARVVTRGQSGGGFTTPMQPLAEVVPEGWKRRHGLL